MLVMENERTRLEDAGADEDDEDDIILLAESISKDC
jgi:hypothetical protein